MDRMPYESPNGNGNNTAAAASPSPRHAFPGAASLPASPCALQPRSPNPVPEGAAKLTTRAPGTPPFGTPLGSLPHGAPGAPGSSVRTAGTTTTAPSTGSTSSQQLPRVPDTDIVDVVATRILHAPPPADWRDISRALRAHQPQVGGTAGAGGVDADAGADAAAMGDADAALRDPAVGRLQRHHAQLAALVAEEASTRVDMLLVQATAVAQWAAERGQQLLQDQLRLVEKQMQALDAERKRAMEELAQLNDQLEVARVWTAALAATRHVATEEQTAFGELIVQFDAAFDLACLATAVREQHEHLEAERRAWWPPCPRRALYEW